MPSIFPFPLPPHASLFDKSPHSRSPPPHSSSPIDRPPSSPSQPLMAAHPHDKPPPLTQPQLLAKLDVAADIDPSCRRSPLEAMKALMHKDVYDAPSLSIFIETLLDAALDKKTLHRHLVLASSSAGDSLPALSLAVLLADVTRHASHLHLKLGLPHISSIAKLLVSWFPLAMEAASQSQLLHQACAKLACAIAENAAVQSNDDNKSFASTCSSPSFTERANESSELNLDSSSSSSSSNDDAPSTAMAIDGLCGPLISAAFSKIEPSSRGGTICLQALVSMDTWKFASHPLIEELCFKASNAMQERKPLSVSNVQMSLLCSLAKKNQVSLSCFRAGLLKKAIQVLLIQNGPWQQRVAAARLIECLISAEDHGNSSVKCEKQAVEALEQCRFDKTAMVRSAVIEALKKVKLHQEQDKEGRDRSMTGVSSESSGSMLKANSVVDYGRRRRKKPLQGTQSSLPQSRTNEYVSNCDGWINKVMPPSGWSSSDSVNSSIDLKCPKRKIARIRHSSMPSPASSTGVARPLLTGSMDFPRSKNNAEVAAPELHRFVEPSSITQLRNLGEWGNELQILNLDEEDDNVCLFDVSTLRKDGSCGSDRDCDSSCVTPTHFHPTPVPLLQNLYEADCHEVYKSPLRLSDDVLSTVPINFVMPPLKLLDNRSIAASEGKRKAPFSDSAWKVRNNPIATDDSEIDSPRATSSDFCSSIYCDDGDDEGEAYKIQTGELEDVSNKSALKAGHCEQSGDYACQTKHAHTQVAGRDGVNSQCASEASSNRDTARERNTWSNTSDAKNSSSNSFLGDGVVACEWRLESPECTSTLHVADDLSQFQFGSLSFENPGERISSFNEMSPKEQFEVLSVHNDSSRSVLKETLKNGEEQGDTVLGVDRNILSCSVEGHRNGCNCSRPDSQSERSTAEEQDRCCVNCGSKIGSAQQQGASCTSINEVVDVADNPHSAVTMEEPDDVVAPANSESIRGNGEEDLASTKCDCALYLQGEEEVVSSSVDNADTVNPVVAKEALEMVMHNTSGSREETACRGKDGELNKKSFVGWVRECYVVKKLGVFGTFFLALTIPLAIMSMINTFDVEEDGKDFLMPT